MEKFLKTRNNMNGMQKQEAKVNQKEAKELKKQPKKRKLIISIF